MSRNGLDQNGVYASDEEMLYVTKEMINYPLGFVIDSGGSVTKVLYRSNKDYLLGKRIKPNDGIDQGVLRTRSFNMNKIGEIIGFLKENCDVITNPKDQVEWWMTGITTQHFKKELDSALKVKTKLFSEKKALANFINHFNDMNNGCFEVDLEALSYAKSITSVFVSFPDFPRSTVENENDQDDCPEEFVTKIKLKESPTSELFKSEKISTWAKKFLSFSGKIEYPALLINLGSAGPIVFAEDESDAIVVDFIYGIGKIFSGLAEEMTGESDFETIMKMAERGKLKNVDLTTDDVRNLEHEEKDWYRYMPKDFTVFELGRLSSHNFKGKGEFSKDDLAAGLLSAILKLTCKIIYLNARLFNVKSILISGSMPKYKIIRHHLQRNLFIEAILANAMGVELIKTHILKHPDFPCALGVWYENVMKQKRRK